MELSFSTNFVQQGGKIIDMFQAHTTVRSTDNAVGHADALSPEIDPSIPQSHETKLGQVGQGALHDPEHLEEPITAPATFWIGKAANEFPNVAAVETEVRRLWAILCDLKAGRAIKISAGNYNLLMEVVSEDFDRIVKHLDGLVHGTFVSRLTQIRNWIGVENIRAFRERLDARRELVPANPRKVHRLVLSVRPCDTGYKRFAARFCGILSEEHGLVLWFQKGNEEPIVTAPCETKVFKVHPLHRLGCKAAVGSKSPRPPPGRSLSADSSTSFFPALEMGFLL